MDKLAQIYRELGVVQARIDSVHEKQESEGLLRKERHEEVKASLSALSKTVITHMEKEEAFQEGVDLRIRKLEADNNQSKGVMGVVMFIAAIVASVVTVIVSKVVSASTVVSKLFH